MSKSGDRMTWISPWRTLGVSWKNCQVADCCGLGDDKDVKPGSPSRLSRQFTGLRVLWHYLAMSLTLGPKLNDYAEAPSARSSLRDADHWRIHASLGSSPLYNHHTLPDITLLCEPIFCFHSSSWNLEDH
jgi:hypothetical protein